jgi:hypothetical protein
MYKFQERTLQERKGENTTRRNIKKEKQRERGGVNLGNS